MRRTITLAFILLVASYAKAQPTFKLEQYASGFTKPVDIENAGDDRLFIIEQAGVVKIIDKDGNTKSTPFLDIKSKVNSSGNEQGLLGLVFHPNYKENGFFFVNYTQTNGDTRIAKYKVSDNDPDVANPDSEVILMEVDQPYGNHNAGDLAFGDDGYLYFGLGDGGSGGDPNNYAQNRQSFLGKMIRIDVDKEENGKKYGIPDDNPFVNDNNTLNEIWAIGVRNPWRFSFDKETYDMWIADVGQDKWEELDFEPADSKGGLNYGWRCYEGDHDYNTSGCSSKDNYVGPIYEYPHSNDGGYSVTGGFVYRGCMYSNLYGVYFMADYASGNFWTVEPDGNNWSVNKKTNVMKSVSTFGQDSKGELYLAVLSAGTIYQVAGESGEEIVITEQPKSQEVCEEDEIKLSITVTGSDLTYQWYKDGKKIDGATEATYTIASAELSDSGMYHVEIGSEVCKSLKIESEKAKLTVGCTNTDEVVFEVSIGIYPVPANNVLNVHYKDISAQTLKIYIIDMGGKIVHKEGTKSFTGVYNEGIIIDHLTPGTYHVKVLADDRSYVRKVVIQ